MKKGKKNLIFMISIIVLILGTLVALNVLSKKQTELKQNEYLIDEDGNVEEVTIDYADIDEEIVVKGLDLTNQPSLGDPNAPVKVVEFGDYKCSHCATWKQNIFPLLNEEYIKTGKVQFYFVNFQFLAPDSLLAGIAGEAIYNQNPDAFWEYNSKLLDKQGSPALTWATKTFLKSFVKENVSGIDYELFNKELDEERYLYEVKRDLIMGDQLGVTSTPTIFVNGAQVVNTYVTIKEAVEEALQVGE